MRISARCRQHLAGIHPHDTSSGDPPKGVIDVSVGYTHVMLVCAYLSRVTWPHESSIAMVCVIRQDIRTRWDWCRQQTKFPRPLCLPSLLWKHLCGIIIPKEIWSQWFFAIYTRILLVTSEWICYCTTYCLCLPSPPVSICRWFPKWRAQLKRPIELHCDHCRLHAHGASYCCHCQHIPMSYRIPRLMSYGIPHMLTGRVCFRLM